MTRFAIECTQLGRFYKQTLAVAIILEGCCPSVSRERLSCRACNAEPGQLIYSCRVATPPQANVKHKFQVQYRVTLFTLEQSGPSYRTTSLAIIFSAAYTMKNSPVFTGRLLVFLGITKSPQFVQQALRFYRYEKGRAIALQFTRVCF